MRLKSISIVALLIAGCASRQPGPIAPAPDTTMIAPGVTMTLSRLTPLESGLDVSQLVQARYQNRADTFLATIQTSPGTVTVMVTMPSGPPLVTIVWEDGKISGNKAPMLPDSMTPDHLLADLMSVYASSTTLNGALTGAKVVDDGTSRTIEQDGKVLVRIVRPAGDTWTGTASLHNLAFGYQLGIKSRRMSP
ncbi:DUF3261 domain-containing protein [Emcibacter sp. SYSU 3D8]|uniref:DUF3261 domain-containing protein n=1 Tax=Emcibacter sp. SYSU 3D8 TaxID=3133969 RepID=UPI0031FF3893